MGLVLHVKKLPDVYDMGTDSMKSLK